MAEAKKSSSASILDQIKASFAMSLTAIIIAVVLLALIFAQILDSDANKFVFVLMALIFATLAGFLVRILAQPGNGSNWVAFLVGALGTLFMLALSPWIGSDGGPPFGDAFVAALFGGVESSGQGFHAEVFTAGTALLGSVALIVNRWGRD